VRVVHLSTLHGALDVRIFHKECRTLAAAGHDVHYLVADAPGAPLDGVRFHGLFRPATRFRPARVLTRLLGVYRRAAALRGDVYHFHDPELIVVGLLLKRDGARVVYDVHEDSPREAVSVNKDRPWHGRVKGWAWSLLESAARRAFDGFVCATPAIARRFPGCRTVTVQNYPLAEEFSDSGSRSADCGVAENPQPAIRNPQSADLAYVGGISAIRGAREMVDLLTCLPESPPVRLKLAGPLHPPGLLRELEQRPGWGRVDYLGVQDRPGVRRVLARARLGLVLFHPERDHLEAMPNKLFEYMAAGLPVVASDFPLWRSIVAATGCGLTANPLDPPAVAAAVRRLLDNPAEAAAMGRRGREAVRERFNWQTEARKLLGLYETLEAA
jgi:glycosyltransferase involved in cell wall biosynthesis